MRYIAFLTVAALFSGCLRDVPVDIPTSGDFIAFEMEAPVDAVTADGLVTRGFDLTMENHVETIDLLIFDMTHPTSFNSGYVTYLCSAYGTDIRNTTATNGEGSVKFKAMLPTMIDPTPGNPGDEISLIGRRLYIMVLANSRRECNDVKGEVSLGDGFRDVLGKVVFTVDTEWDVETPRYLPMASLAGARQIIITPEKELTDEDGFKLTKIYVPELIRSVVSFDIGFNYVWDDELQTEIPMGFDHGPGGFGFEIEEASLCNIPDKGYITGDMIQTNVHSYWYGSPPLTDYVNIDFHADRSARGMFGEIYAPAAFYADLDRTEGLCLLVGGYYTAPEAPENTTALTWYKVDLNLPDVMEMSLGSWFLRRNSKVLVKVTDITGPGYSTREDALNGTGGIGDGSLKVNLSAVPWTEGNTQENNLGGRHGFEISRNSFRFMDDAARTVNDSHDDNVLWLKTDYSGGWRVDGIEYEDGSNETWLSTDIVRGDPFMLADLHILTRANTTGNGRIGYINLSAGRWTYRVKVQQSEYVKITPAEGVFGPWGQIVGYHRGNIFEIEPEGGEAWSIVGVTYPSGVEDWGVVPRKIDNRSFYVQFPENSTTALRTAFVNINTGNRVVSVKITQDWTDCGIGGVVRELPFGNYTVETQMIAGGSLYDYAVLPMSEGLQSYLSMVAPIEARYVLSDVIVTYPNPDHYTCWMLDNSDYNAAASAVELDGRYYYTDDDDLEANACPEGWRLPNVYDLFSRESGIDGLFYEGFDGRPGIDGVRAAVMLLWSEDRDQYPGYYDPATGTVVDAGFAGHFPTGWDGLISEGMLREKFRQFPGIFNSEEVIASYVQQYANRYYAPNSYNIQASGRWYWMYYKNTNPDDHSQWPYPYIKFHGTDNPYQYYVHGLYQEINDTWPSVENRKVAVRCVKDYPVGKWR